MEDFASGLVILVIGIGLVLWLAYEWSALVALRRDLKEMALQEDAKRSARVESQAATRQRLNNLGNQPMTQRMV